MRFSTIASIAVIGLSTAAIAQVTRAPTGQKIENGNEMAVGVNPIATSANDASPTDEAMANLADTPAVNTANAAPPPGEPSSASNAPPKG